MKKSALLLFIVLLPVYSGNKDRIGEAGAPELLINPLASSTALHSANSVFATGVDAIFLNPGGVILIPSYQFKIARVNYLSGSDISINSLSMVAKLNEFNAISLAVVTFNTGEIPITTEDNPDGGIGVYKPQIFNIYGGYSRAFSDRIFGGFNIKELYHSIGNVSGQALAIDGGILYATGERKNLRFGLALRNIGYKMSYSGEGLYKIAEINGIERTISERSQLFELPSQMLLGVSYDFYPPTPDTLSHRFTPMLTFVSNAFGKDQVRLGIEYGYKSLLRVRAGFLYEDGIFSQEMVTTVYKIYAVGVGFHIPISSNFSIGIDYSYQATRAWNGNHAFALDIRF